MDKLLELYNLRITTTLKHNLEKLTKQETEKMLTEVRNVMAPTWKFWHPIKGAAKFAYTQPTIGGLFFKLPDNHGEIQVVRKKYPLEHIYSALRKV